MNSKVQWEFGDINVLVSPKGITTDDNNNIDVVGGRSNNVVAISPDGRNHKVLVSDRGYQIMTVLALCWRLIVTEQAINYCYQTKAIILVYCLSPQLHRHAISFKTGVNVNTTCALFIITLFFQDRTIISRNPWC